MEINLIMNPSYTQVRQLEHKNTKKIQDMVNALVLKDQIQNDQERYLLSNQIFQCLVHVLVLVLVLLHYPQTQ